MIIAIVAVLQKGTIGGQRGIEKIPTVQMQKSILSMKSVTNARNVRTQNGMAFSYLWNSTTSMEIGGTIIVGI